MQGSAKSSLSSQRRAFRWYKLILVLFTGLLLFLGVSLGFFTLPVALLIHNTGPCTTSAAFSAIRQYEILWNSLRVGRKMRRLEQTSDGLQKWSTPLGNFWAPPKTWVSLVVSEQMLRIYGDGADRVRLGDVVVDCGANIGTFTREALLAGASIVISIEPSPHNVECLRRTFQEEIAAGRVRVVAVGVWDKDDKLLLSVYDNSALDSFVMKTRTEEASATRAKQVEVPVTTVDKIVAEQKLDRVTFIKMDIEGAERNALRGASDTIRRFRPRMAIATENLEDDYRVLPEVVASIDSGYRIACGRCKTQGLTAIRPEVLFFRP